MKHKRSTMEYIVSCVAFGLLFLAHIFPSNAADITVTGSFDDDTGRKFYDVGRNLTLRCDVNPTPAGKEPVLEWLKNNTNINDVESLKNRFTVTGTVFNIKYSKEDDYGPYTCRLANQTSVSAEFDVMARPHVKLPANSNVVEGQKLKITCTIVGKPRPTISWLYSNGSANETYTESAGRVQLGAGDDGVPGAVLTLAEAEPADAGDYYCVASAAPHVHVAVTTLRVKDKFAALWPFLGICAEVLVLCAIILIYEKRRTKPDLEDSDTDNHDQKQSVDGRKDSDVRQRK